MLRAGFLTGCAIVAMGCGDPTRSNPFTQTDPDASTTPDIVAPPMDASVTADVPAGSCTSSAQCNDNQMCTDDECVFGGRCEYTPVNSRCPAGQRCVLGVGCSTGMSCTTSAQCDDGVPCTRDLCAAGGMCQNVNDDSRCTGGQVCISTGCAAAGSCARDTDCNDRVFCNGSERCVSARCAAGAAMDCRDTDPCTGDICNEAMMRCDHPPVSPCGGTVMPGTYTLAPAVSYSCGAGSLGPVARVMLMTTGSGVTVTGFPAMLSGAAPSDGMFTASGSESRGGCTWRYTLSGAFTMPDRFSGSWNVSFDFCSASLGCFPQFGIVSGTRM